MWVLLHFTARCFAVLWLHPPCVHCAAAQVLKIGQLEFNDLWHEGPSSFVRMVTKPEFGSWVPKSVAGQLQSSNLEFHDIM